METVKARIQGNSVVLTVPKAFNVNTGTEYTVVRQSDGSILYQPKDSYDIWADSSLDNFDYVAELQREYLDLGYNPREVRLVGREKLND